MTIEDQVRTFVVDNFLFGGGSVADDASLMGEGVVDSTGILELVMFVEETYGITVSDEDVVPDNFDSISALAAYVSAKSRDAVTAIAS
jgi:acyl carrier protein